MPKYLITNDQGYCTQHTGYIPVCDSNGRTEYTGQQLPCFPDGTPLTAEEIAQKEQEAEDTRIAGLAEVYKTKVTELENTLSTFGIVLPTTIDEVIPVMIPQVKTDPSLSADSQLAQIQYNSLLQSGLSDADIYAISQTTT